MIVLHGRRLQLTIHFSFFAVLLLLTQLTRSDWGLWCVGACLLHEAGHILAYSAFGAFPKAIHLEAGGIRIVPPDRPLPPKAEELVLLACRFSTFSAAEPCWRSAVPMPPDFTCCWELLTCCPFPHWTVDSCWSFWRSTAFLFGRRIGSASGSGS